MAEHTHPTIEDGNRVALGLEDGSSGVLIGPLGADFSFVCGVLLFPGLVFPEAVSKLG